HFSFHSPDLHRDLHSFPTRRSSDLSVPPACDDAYWLSGAGHPGRCCRCCHTRPPPPSCRSSAHWPDWCRAQSWESDRCCDAPDQDRKSTRLNSSHVKISYAVFCLKK